MSDLSTASVAVLSTFRHAPKGMLSVKKLCRLLLDAAAYEYRVGELISAGLIEPCRWEPSRTVNGVFFSGAATAFRLTVKGSDYLAQLTADAPQPKTANRQDKHNAKTKYLKAVPAILGVMAALVTIIDFLLKILS